MTEHVLTQRVTDHLVGFQLVKRFAERARQFADPLGGNGRGVHLEERLLDRVGQLETLLDAIKTCGDHRGEGEVGIRRRIGASDFRPGALDGLAR